MTCCSVSVRTANDYGVYKPYLMFWALVELVYSTLFKFKVPVIRL